LRAREITLTISGEAFRDVLLKEIRNNLMGFQESVYQGFGQVSITVIVEGCGETSLSSTTSAT